jgi:hypothetical protein
VTGEGQLPTRTAQFPPMVDWHRLDVAAMWAMIEKEDDYLSRVQADAWNRTYGHLDDFRVQLQALAEALERAWPPVPDSAALDFQQRLTRLIKAVTATSHDASGNALAVSSIADTLTKARATMAQINNNWQQPTTSSSPTMQPALQDRAARTMREADQASYDYGTALKVPELLYQAPYYARESGSPMGLHGSAPASDPSPHSAAYPGASPRDTTAPASSPFLLASGDATQPVSNLPILASGAPLGPGSGTMTGPAVPLPVGSGHGPRPQSGGAPGSGASWVWNSRGGTGDRYLGGSSDEPTVGRYSSRPLESDVRGSKAASSTPGETTHSGSSPAGGLGLGGGIAARRSGRRSSGEPYTEWQVKQGVPAVLKPPPEPTDHDPGPIFGAGR